jgi:hypothetical protein
MQNCAFDPAFWQAINSILARDRKSWFQTGTLWYHDFFLYIASEAFAISGLFHGLSEFHIREVKYQSA